MRPWELEWIRLPRVCPMSLFTKGDQISNSIDNNNSIREIIQLTTRDWDSLLILDKAIMNLFKRNRSIAVMHQHSSSTLECNLSNNLPLATLVLANLAKALLSALSNNSATTLTSLSSKRCNILTRTCLTPRVFNKSALNLMLFPINRSSTSICRDSTCNKRMSQKCHNSNSSSSSNRYQRPRSNLNQISTT